MPWFLCVYPAWPHMTVDTNAEVGDYSSFIRAPDMKHAEKLAKRRGLGEKVIAKSGRDKRPYPLPSEVLAKRSLTTKQRMEVIHGTCFLSYLLMQSLKTPPGGIVGDEGLLHQVIHCVSLGSPRRKDMVETLRHFERLVPGYA